MKSLQVSGSHVIHDGVAENVFKSLFFWNVSAFATDDDCQFDFIVQFLGYLTVTVDNIIWTNHGSGWFGEYDGIFWNSDIRIFGFIKFHGMFGIIFADAKNVFAWPGDGSHDFDIGERNPGAGIFI